MHFEKNSFKFAGQSRFKNQNPSTMKRLFLFAFVASMGLASCKKDYTCECTYGGDNVDGDGTWEYKDVKESDAEDSCDEQESSLEDQYGEANCELNEK